jgi:chromosome segregation protein
VRLVQIRLAGFKSFVDPTAIHIPGHLVGIVGPNGCGKSNVIDAARWVLGETRASALRGDSMQDVIFNGSVNRKPLARASVELIFDNALGRAAGQWSQYAEISVKRVLQRDGESSYYINGTHVRRRDVTDIFLGTGLGPRAYAIIEQGMISRVIEAKPEELRVFLEEAAGVSRYRERRKETEHRLAVTRDNLARVTDIRSELAQQIEKLEAQAKVATQYRALQDDMAFKQHLLWFLRRKEAAGERERHAREIARCETELEAATATLREVERQAEGARAAHYEAGDALNAAQAAVYAANAEVARHESELRHVEETRARLEGRHTERSAQLGSWREQRAQLTQALHLWAGRSGEARRRVGQAEERLARERTRLPEAEGAHRAALEQLNEARGQQMQCESRLQLEQQGLAHLERGLQALAQRAERLESELGGLAEPEPEAIASARARVSDLHASIAAAQAGVAECQAQAAEGEAARAAAAAALAEASRDQAAGEAQLRTLRQVQAAAEDNAQLRDWLERHRLAALPRLWQRIRIDHGWETAVESVLRERLHALQAGEAPLLARIGADLPPVKASLYAPGEAEAPAPLAGHVPLLAKVHAADAQVGGAISDWFAGAYAFEGTPGPGERAGLPPGVVLVNRDGHQYTRYTVSFHAPDPEHAGILARQAEIEDLEQRCGALAARERVARGQAERLDAAHLALQHRLDEARALLAARERERHDAEIEALKLEQALERTRERGAQIREALEEIRAEAERDRARIEQGRAAAAHIEGEIEAARERLRQVKERHLLAETALAAQRVDAQQAEREAQDALFGERECTSKIAEIDHAVRLVDQQIAQAEEELTKLTAELAVDPVPALRKSLHAAVETRMACEKTLAAARDHVERAAQRLRGLEEERLRIESRLAPLRERVGELRLKEQAARLSAEQFELQLRGGRADEQRLAAESDGAPRPAALQAEIARLGQAIAELGAVNLAALDELAASRERKGFLDAQSADLEEAVVTLLEAIRRIDRETRELLRDTFESVNRHFGTLFPVLFGGGEAKLLMTGEEILDAGLQVMAQPPGKRNSTIHLLSGGEKALTAIALVFAMFQLNPAPFCLLDEVDAPLDDTNTMRFCDLVRTMSAHTQFIFISHNKITMEMAGQLIGVTMPESGVSRVVAVDIEEALRIREELAA